MRTACIELELADEALLSIDCTAVENEVVDNMYQRFIKTLRDNPVSYYAFETLYWCGLRLGEMLALTPADFDFERKIIHVTKSFQRIKGEDIITPSKTKKGIRRVLMPDFYADKMQAYVEPLQLNKNDRIFPFTKSLSASRNTPWLYSKWSKTNTDPRHST